MYCLTETQTWRCNQINCYVRMPDFRIGNFGFVENGSRSSVLCYWAKMYQYLSDFMELISKRHEQRFRTC